LFSGTGVAWAAGIEIPLSPTARLLGVSEDPLMDDDDRLHIVFGTGQVGSALAAHLAGMGHAVRAVSRHRPAPLAGVDWRAADAAKAFGVRPYYDRWDSRITDVGSGPSQLPGT
jgi:hypothetical protein